MMMVLYNLTTSKAIQPRIRCQWVASAAVDFFRFSFREDDKYIKGTMKTYTTIDNTKQQFELQTLFVSGVNSSLQWVLIDILRP